MHNFIIRRRVLLFAIAILAWVVVGNSNHTKIVKADYSSGNIRNNPTSFLDDGQASGSPVTNVDAENPLLAKWEGPYGGVPPFDRIQVIQFKPALEMAMAENLTEVDRIAKDPGAPTFDNTIVAMERAGRTFDRVTTVYGVWGSTMAGP